MAKQGIRTQIIDKNGKQTTVIKKDQTASRPKRAIPVATVNAAIESEDIQLRNEVISQISDRRILNRVARDSDEMVAQLAQSSGGLNGQDYDRLYDEKALIPWAALNSPTIVDMDEAKLKALLADSGTGIRLSAAKNYNMSEDVLDVLKKDSNPGVASAAQKSLVRHYRRNHRNHILETIYPRLDADYDNNEGVWVGIDYKEKIERALSNVPADADYYEREDHNLGVNLVSARYQTVNGLIASSRVTGSTTFVEGTEYQQAVDKLTNDLFRSAGLEHEIPYPSN